MKPPLLQVCTIVQTTRDKFGNLSVSSTEDVQCKFRYIDELVRVGNQENIQSQAMAWFNPDEAVSEGTLFKVDGDSYRVDRVIKARRLHESTVLFLKTLVSRYFDLNEVS